jgi:hypothetical protein
MAEVRAEIARDDAADVAFWTAVRGARAREAEAQQRRAFDELARLVDEFGSTAVEVISRRTDPGFELPVELRGRKGSGA